jgi:lon-related putative ATP-dependent protease
MAKIKPLSARKLCQECKPSQFTFKTTDELEDLTDVIGQDRAVEAIQFGIGIQREGYNLFALGPSGTGKRTTIGQFLDLKAAAEPTPPDWVYVNDFEKPHKPRAIKLPSGLGVVLRDDMEELLEELQTAIPAAFESEDYRTRKQEVEEEFKERQEQAFTEVQKKAQERNVSLIRTPVGLAFAPMQDGDVVSPEDFQKLPEEERKRVESEIGGLQEYLQEAIYQVRQWEREARDKMKDLDREVAMFAVGHYIDDLRQKYADLPEIVDHLNAVQEDVIDNVEEFRKTEEAPQIMGIPLPPSLAGAPLFRRYQVNVIIDHSESEGAPVIFEEHPTFNNLIGRVEHIAQMGALVTDFNLIKPGALHLANGGYLIIDARQLLLQPYAWDGLKRVLRSRELRIESLGQALSLVSTVSLAPDPIPLDVKVILIGERMLYYLLYEYDPDFGELFKVEVDFNQDMDRSPEANQLYARLIATLARKNELRPFDRGAVAQIITRSARMVGDSEKMSVHLLSVADLLRESDYWAGEAGHRVVRASDVERAIEAQIYRSDRVRERVQERIRRGTTLIDTRGERVGQINGLSVLMLGNFAFGQPSRITARIRMGSGKVIDIEREVELGGPIHSKGVLILSSFLGSRYAPKHPLSLSASLVFEQSYGGVDGDSASMAELCTLLSALAEVPIKQSLAITGSVNQHGEAQPIGGVNEKIEGFFDVCNARGLTGEQGVIIPASNVEHLMLRQDVVAAVRAKQFQIYAIETVDQAVELLTGVPAGRRLKEGGFTAGSINQRVESRLIELAETQRDFSSPPEKDDAKQEG